LLRKKGGIPLPGEKKEGGKKRTRRFEKKHFPLRWGNQVGKEKTFNQKKTK